MATSNRTLVRSWKANCDIKFYTKIFKFQLWFYVKAYTNIFYNSKFVIWGLRLYPSQVVSFEMYI